MKKLIFSILFLIQVLTGVAVTHSVYNLKCEYSTNPLNITKDMPRFSWCINANERNFIQSAWHILISDDKNLLDKNKGNIWDSKKQISSQSYLIQYAGVPLVSNKIYYWKVKVWDGNKKSSNWSLINTFRTGLKSSDWEGANWIALEKDKIKILPGVHDSSSDKKKYKDAEMYHMPQFRKEINLTKKVKSAVAYVSGLGQFDLFINGEKAGNNFLDPGWTRYDKTALYKCFDITEQLTSGVNTLGVMLGNGFFNIPAERYYKLLVSYGAPRLIMQVIITYKDGTKDIVSTNKNWKVTESPITYSSIYGGEDYDANKEKAGWLLPGYNDDKWQNAIDTKWITKLVADSEEPLKVKMVLPVVKILKTQKGNYVYDFGQNFSGIISMQLNSTKKQNVKLWPAELIKADTTVNQKASGSPYYFSYTTKGVGNESWQPQFSYYGFRYVQLEGAVPAGEPNPKGLPVITKLKGLHTCNSAQEVSSFSCSDTMFNKIHTLIDWAIRSNMASVLTDCPHREKLGWLEQDHLMQYSLLYRYYLPNVYSKIMMDMKNSQASDGMIACIAPEYVEFSGGFKDTPEWGSSFIISPWYIYKWYGDKSLLINYYSSMKAYLKYLTSRSSNHIISYGLGDWFDIGPGNPGYAQLTSNSFTATAIYYYDITIMEKIAGLLKNTDDATAYKNLANEVKSAFNKKFWKKGIYDRNSQTANAMALYVDLADSINKKQVLNNLIKDIQSRNNALTAGDIGYRYVLRILEANDRSDVIYDMNCKYDVPGYGWQLAHGATALTESWQAYSSVSNNHFMLGHLMEWLYSGLGGLRLKDNSVAFKEFIIHPAITGDISYANIKYQSPYGLIRSEWKNIEKSFDLTVQVPANSFAYIYLPASDINKVSESGIPLKKLQHITTTVTDKNIVVKTGSGNYHFSVIK